MKATTAGYPCDQCERVFPTSQGRAVHKVRKHGRGWDTSGNFGPRRGTKGNPSNEPRLVRRREYQRNLRARYYAEGRNSHGEKMPAGWKPRRQLVKPVPPSKQPEYKSKYARNHYRKMKALRNGAAAPAQSDQLGDAAKAILLAAKVLRGTLTALKLP